MSCRACVSAALALALAAGSVGAQVTISAAALTETAGPLGPGLSIDSEFFSFTNFPGPVVGGDGVATFLGRGDLTPDIDNDNLPFAGLFRKGPAGMPTEAVALAAPGAPAAPGFGLPFFDFSFTLFSSTIVTGPGGETSALLPVNSFSPVGVFTDVGGSLSLVAGEGLTVMPGVEPGALFRGVLGSSGGSLSGVKINANGRTAVHGVASVMPFANEHQGLWATTSGGGLVALAVQGGVLPLPSQPVFQGFGSFAWSGNDRAVFQAFTTEGQALCTSVEGALTVLMTDDDNPLGEGNASFTGVRQNDAGDLALDIAGPITSAILVDRSGTGTAFTEVVRTLTTNPFVPAGLFVPPLGGSVLGGGGHVAFTAETESAGITQISGVYRQDPDGQLRAIALGGDPAPGFPAGSAFLLNGLPGVSGLFSDVSINSLGQVLFRAWVEVPGPGGIDQILSWYVASPLPGGGSELVPFFGSGNTVSIPGLPPGFATARVLTANTVASSGDQDGGQVSFVALPVENPTFGRAGFQAIIDNNNEFDPEIATAILLVDIPAPPAEPPCVADTNGDGILSPADFSAWIAAFNAQSPACDQNGDGQCLPNDFSAWIANFNAGCP